MSIVSRPYSERGRLEYDRIFNKEKREVRNEKDVSGSGNGRKRISG